jgi:Kyanoviridae head maturation protease
MSDTKLRRLENYDVFDYKIEKVEVPPLLKEVDGKTVEVPQGPKILMKGILQKADTLNQNGRIYPKAVLDREVRNYQKFIIENRAVGELDHPDSSVVNLKNVSHVVREAYMEANGAVVGTIEVLAKTPSGAILAGLVESGIKLGISSRGVGSTRKQGEYYVVQDDFQLICWDMVSEPSTPGAFMIPEGKIIDEDELREVFKRSDRIDRVLNEILSCKVR